ncbi:GntR family transcriptional regulator [Planctomicrobium sp. SH664]|uniref:GntR family transcriptional regulator n=1 Tax=Planctomicrobium sp. SH664 TaxID=3448125 RepID=UPI003F5CB456
MRRSAAVIPVHTQIASRLRADVYRGTFSKGEQLREEELAARFGVSRSPIRQVLQQLTYEGLLHSRANWGTVVAESPTPEVAEVLYDCRAKLECIALRECFSNLDESDFQYWREILDLLYDACAREDHGAAYYYDSLFHRVAIDKAAPAGSLGVYTAIAGAVDNYSRIPANRSYHADFLELYGMHAALYEVFRHGDPEIACEALSQHILRGPFCQASCQCWIDAGKPREYEGIYDRLIPELRRAVAKRVSPSSKSSRGVKK